MNNRLSNQHAGSFLFSHWKILIRVTWNELSSRYAGSLFGIGWAFLSPLLILAIYSVVYSFIFRIQIHGLSTAQYILLIFAGLVPFLMTSEAIMSGVSSILSNKAILANTVFPIDLIPPKSVLMSQVTMMAGMGVTIIALIVTDNISWTVALLPLIWILHIMALLGITWIISLTNLIFRDMQNLVGPTLMILMIMSPIAYTPDMVPPQLKFLVLFNPFAYYVVFYQKVMVMGTIPTLTEWIAVSIISLTLFWFGGWFFVRAKKSLIDYV